MSSTETTPLKYMGTQSRETMAMEAAMALSDKVDEANREVSQARGKIGEAASRALGSAKDTLQSAAEDVRDRATTAVATYTKEDPIRAILIAAGAGALLVGLLAMMARSGARTVKRKIQRSRR
jgi:ElaB/YqjD/DUF883 family membrane-anchored ribosome-binding protein